MITVMTAIHSVLRF